MLKYILNNMLSIKKTKMQLILNMVGSSAKKNKCTIRQNYNRLDYQTSNFKKFNNKTKIKYNTSDNKKTH